MSLLKRTRNETVDDIQQLEKSIQRCKDNIDRLQHDKHSFNPKNMIERNKKDIEKYTIELEKLKIKLDKIDNGLYEETLKQELESNLKIRKEKTLVTSKKKAAATPAPVVVHNKEKRTPPKRVWDVSEREMLNAEKYYFKDAASLPDHLYEKLETMPGNMGYIWKNIWFFGRDPPKNDSVVMFEKTYNHFYIHTIRGDTYTIHEKNNDGSKTLIQSKHVQRIRF